MSRPLGLSRRSLFISTALVAFAAVPLAPIAAQTVQSISAKDKAEGAKAHPQLLEEFGGAATGSQAAYVETVGKNIAIQSGLSNARGDFTVTLLNSSVDNAFAIPGGYVYVTRQLVALMNNEAELAGVLGHEIGHVAARHSAKRQSAATRNSILSVIGQVLGSVIGGSVGNLLGQGAQYGSQILTLKYSRSQETEADNLGIAYLQRAGYDSRAMGTVLQSLANQNALDVRLQGSPANRAPEWASTHPDPASRVRAALTRAGANATGVTNRDTFLSRIDGLTYGDDPKQGIVEGRNFTHPEFRLAFQAPSGFYMINGTRAVSINGQSGKGQLSTAPFNGNLEEYVETAFASLTQQGQAQVRPSTLERTTVNGIPAAYGISRVNSGSGQVDVVIFAYAFSQSQAFHFMTISQAGRSSVFDPMFRSMRRISATEAAAVKPRRLTVVTANRGDTVQSLAARMAYTDSPLDRFRVLNGFSTSSTIAVGQRVKLVTY